MPPLSPGEETSPPTPKWKEEVAVPPIPIWKEEVPVSCVPPIVVPPVHPLSASRPEWLPSVWPNPTPAEQQGLSYLSISPNNGPPPFAPQLDYPGHEIHNHNMSQYPPSDFNGDPRSISPHGVGFPAITVNVAPLPPQHKRVYQACIPCRRRKVKCDLGAVDNPSEPPCVRCRRESKECFFSATRRKRKNEDDEEDQDHDEYIIRNGRKRHHGRDTPSIPNDYRDRPLTPGGSRARDRPLRRPGADDSDQEDANGHASVENLEAQNLMGGEIYGPHDALNLLYKAATDNPQQFAPDKNAATSVELPPNATPERSASAREKSVLFNSRVPGRKPPPRQESLDPRLFPTSDGADKASIEEKLKSVEAEEGYAEALNAWSRFRFVRAGWFTNVEAIRYIVYYYEYLSPMTPVSPPAFRKPCSHPTLLAEEPVLSVTLLTIATRYYNIQSPGGHCRSHAIHEELWRYLRKMIEKCLWGQESFGGGFCGSGADFAQTSSTAPWRGLRKGSLRTLGTIESLMLLTEWHPRALHFPPEEAVDELMLPDPSEYGAAVRGEDTSSRPPGNIGGRRIESWLEPAWRSDRMCWMLLSNAMGLAYELGVFDDIDELLAADAIPRPEYEDEAYRLRAMRIKRLLLIYLTQLAGRLGWTNMVPESIRKTDPVFSNRRPGTAHEGNTPKTNTSVTSSSFNYIPNILLDDQVIHCWVGVSNAMHLGNEKLFRSRKHTTEIISSGKYTELLKEFKPLLDKWWKEFKDLNLPEFIRHVLTIEYQYVRIYVYSLALQAVMERCTNGATESAGAHTTLGDMVNGSAQHFSPGRQQYLGNLPLGHLGGFGVEDQQYVREVVEGSRGLLETVVDGLLPKGYLKHAPVRTYFRIVSGAMFLLKTFALGASKADVEKSIALLDRSVDALRGCVVDDVHLGIRFGDLLESLTSRLRSRFILAPGSNVDGKASQIKGEGAGDSQRNEVESAFASQAHRLRQELSVPERTSSPSNITATPFDMRMGDFPYPPGSASIFRNNTTAQSGNVLEGNNSNNNVGDGIFEHENAFTPHDDFWYLPPGPALFSGVGENANVTMTDQGINNGGVDLLEFMAMDNNTAPFHEF